MKKDTITKPDATVKQWIRFKQRNNESDKSDKEVNGGRGYFSLFTIYHLRTCLYFLLNYGGAEGIGVEEEFVMGCIVLII